MATFLIHLFGVLLLGGGASAGVVVVADRASYKPLKSLLYACAALMLLMTALVLMIWVQP